MYGITVIVYNKRDAVMKVMWADTVPILNTHYQIQNCSVCISLDASHTMPVYSNNAKGGRRKQRCSFLWGTHWFLFQMKHGSILSLSITFAWPPYRQKRYMFMRTHSRFLYQLPYMANLYNGIIDFMASQCMMLLLVQMAWRDKVCWSVGGNSYFMPLLCCLFSG